MIIILIIASVVSALVSYYDGSGDYIDSIIIVFIVVLNAIMGVVQEEKAEKSLEALKSMTAPVAKVKRNGDIFSIKAEEVVPGDIIILEAGNYVPADSRIIKKYLCISIEMQRYDLFFYFPDFSELFNLNISLGFWRCRYREVWQYSFREFGAHARG